MPLVPRLSEEHKFQNISCKTIEKKSFVAQGFPSTGRYLYVGRIGRMVACGCEGG